MNHNLPVWLHRISNIVVDTSGQNLVKSEQLKCIAIDLVQGFMIVASDHGLMLLDPPMGGWKHGR